MPLATSAALPLPLFASRLRAGFPSPADDYLEGKIDLNKYLVEHEAATFLVRIEGDSMTGAGIFHDDIAIVDRSLVTSKAFPGQLTQLPLVRTIRIE